MTRLRELVVGDFALWRDRVPAIHGTVCIVTLWRHSDKGWIRQFGGLTRLEAIDAIRDLKVAA